MRDRRVDPCAVLIDHDLAIDQDERNALRRPAWNLVRRHIAYPLGVETDHISCRTGAQMPTIEQTRPLRWQTCHLAYHLLEPNELEFTNIFGQVSRERAPRARMRAVADDDTVAARHMGRVLENGPDVLLIAGERNGAGSQIVGQQQVTVEVEWRWLTGGQIGGIRHAVPDVPAVLATGDRGQHNPGPVDRTRLAVFHLLTDPRARVRIVQPGENRGMAALMHPAGRLAWRYVLPAR